MFAATYVLHPIPALLAAMRDLLPVRGSSLLFVFHFFFCSLLFHSATIASDFEKQSLLVYGAMADIVFLSGDTATALNMRTDMYYLLFSATDEHQRSVINVALEVSQAAKSVSSLLSAHATVRAQNALADRAELDEDLKLISQRIIDRLIVEAPHLINKRGFPEVMIEFGDGKKVRGRRLFCA